MCGRYSEPDNKAYRDYGVELPANYERSYNVSPFSSQPILVKKSPLRIEMAIWGLIPSWSREFKPAFTTFNARKEGIMTSKVFKRPFLTQRCLTLASAFYEWRQIPDSKDKQRFVIKPRDREYFSFASFYDVWKDAEGKPFYSFTLVTTDPTESIAAIHNREAVILRKEDEEAWLNTETTVEELMDMLQPYPDNRIEAYPAAISSIKRGYDASDLLAPATR